MLSSESYLSLLGRVVYSVERICMGDFFLFWAQKESLVPCVYSMKFITKPTTLCMSICIVSLQLVILELQLFWVSSLWRSRAAKPTTSVGRSRFPADVHLWNLLQSDVFCGGTLSSFKSAMNLCL